MVAEKIPISTLNPLPIFGRVSKVPGLSVATVCTSSVLKGCSVFGECLDLLLCAGCYDRMTESTPEVQG